LKQEKPVGLSLAERIMLEDYINQTKALNNLVAQQGIQIAALIETHPDAQKVRDIIDPPPAAPEPAAFPTYVSDFGKAPIDLSPQITIPEQPERKKPGPKPKLHGEMRTIAMGTSANV
jgi:hypothetical protein